jgi:hypothetical protein
MKLVSEGTAEATPLRVPLKAEKEYLPSTRPPAVERSPPLMLEAKAKASKGKQLPPTPPRRKKGSRQK